jgi:hypothetical protein
MGDQEFRLLIGLAGALVIGGSVWALVVLRPRRQVAGPFVISLLLSIAVYLVNPQDPDYDFQVRLTFAVLVALAVGVLCGVTTEDLQEKAGRISFALLGVAIPPPLFLGLLVATCSDQCFS